jgi:divalent metal cation (Fe/Co/Zn/Cd) transporter
VILLFAIVLESISLRTAYREAKHRKPVGISWWAWIRRAKEPELPVVLLEDTGAEIGLAFALTGVLLAHYTDEPRWDALGSIAIGALLVVIAILLAIEMKGLLIGESASRTDVTKITSTLASAPSVRRVIHLRTEHLGPDELLVVAKLEFDRDLSFDELAAAIDEAERELREAVPIAHLVYIEPDVYRPAVPGS